MKSIRKSNLFTTTVLMLFIFSIIGFWGCEKDSLFDTTHTEHLDLNSYELTQMSEEDFKTIDLAMQRLVINNKNGLYQIEQTSGAQVNISEELYDFIAEGFGYTNKISRPKSLNNSILRLKSGDTEATQDTTNCVAIALSYMGGSCSLDSIRNYLQYHYGIDGIPDGALDSIVKAFYPSSIKTYSPSTGLMDNALFYYRVGVDSGHAVNGYYRTDNGFILYKDNSTGGSGFRSQDSIYGGYYYPNNQH